MTFTTAGEALARRSLVKEKRAGIPHFKTGQHDAFVEDGVAYLTYVNVLGEVWCVPFQKDDAGEWFPAGVYSSAGQLRVGPICLLPDEFVVTDKMREALAQVREERHD